jgi:hypothetical protein
MMPFSFAALKVVGRTIRESSVQIELVLENETRFVRHWTLPFRIVPDESTYVFMPTKVDFALRKLDGDAWNLSLFN